LFVVAAQRLRLRPPLCGAFETFLVIVHYFLSLLRNVSSGRFAAPAQRFSSSSIIVCRRFAAFAAAASRRLRNVSRHRPLLFVVASQRFLATFPRGACATFLVIVY
jgi:hypothetical protein